MKKLLASVLACFILSSCVSIEERKERVEIRKKQLKSISDGIPEMALEFENFCIPILNGTPVDDVIERLISEQYVSVSILQASPIKKFKVLRNTTNGIQIQVMIDSKVFRQCNVFVDSSNPELMSVTSKDNFLRVDAEKLLIEIGRKFAAERSKKLKMSGNKHYIGVFFVPEFEFSTAFGNKTLGMVGIQYLNHRTLP